MKTVKKTFMSTVGVGILAQLLVVSPVAADEEYYTIKDGVLERPTGYLLDLKQ